MEIRTNNVPRNILSAYELTDKERLELDYINFLADEDGSFFRYKGQIYDLGEFMRTDYFKDYDGVCADTYFSGILVKYCSNYEQVIVAQYFN